MDNIDCADHELNIGTHARIVIYNKAHSIKIF